VGAKELKVGGQQFFSVFANFFKLILSQIWVLSSWRKSLQNLTTFNWKTEEMGQLTWLQVLPHAWRHWYLARCHLLCFVGKNGDEPENN
jgi:hypothetical protein